MAIRGKSIKVIKKSSTGRNLKFQDKKTGKIMPLQTFVKTIEDGKYLGYHIRKIKGIKTPVSNPDRKEGNNLG